MTTSTVRVVASHRELQMPFKRYMIGPAWRYERPTKNRFREFWQADVDIFGVKDTIADAEVLCATVEAFSRLGFEGFIIYLNDRRILRSIVDLAGIPKDKNLEVIRVVDKIKKIGREGVLDELKDVVPYKKASIKLIDLISPKGEPVEVIDAARRMLKDYPEGIAGCDDLDNLIKYAKAFGFAEYIVVDLSLARGLDYYTGPIYEIFARGYEEYSSIAGGGRYDELVELFGGDPTPATGISFGPDRLVLILEDKGAFKDLSTGVKVYVAPVSDQVKMKAVEITQNLRKAGVSSIVDLMRRSLGKQLEYVDKSGIQTIVVVGEKDLAKGSLTVRDMKTGDQKKVKTEELLSYLESLKIFSDKTK